MASSARPPSNASRSSNASSAYAPGTLRWRGPFDPDSDPLWRDMLADRISEREYWRLRAAEVGRLIGEEWTSPHMMMVPALNEPIDSTTRPEALATVRTVREAGRKVGVLSNELDLFKGPASAPNYRF